MTRVLYLHGFASGPTSTKACYFRSALEAAGARVEVPDLATGDFEHLTLTSQLAILETLAANSPVALVGSSMGGYLAALYAASHPEVSRLVLLAPAFCFVQRWRERLGDAEIEQWRQTNKLSVYHYSDKANRNLSFDLIPDAEQYPPFPDFHQPALIFQGRRDDIVPPHYAEQFAATHPNAKLEILDSGHDLLDQLDHMAARVVPFLK
jgi:pimeloyl-ACP methyl ester carboxylesterase